jgi:hypothetical protein
LLEQGVDGLLLGWRGKVGSALRNRIEFVEEQQTRRRRSRVAKYAFDGLRRAPDILADDFAERRPDEAEIELAGDCSREERLAAARRAVQQDAVAHDAVAARLIGASMDGGNDPAHLVLQGVHAANAREVDRRDRRLTHGGGRAVP